MSDSKKKPKDNDISTAKNLVLYSNEIGRLRELLASAYVELSGKANHSSDCATSNSPAMTPGKCDCFTNIPQSETTYTAVSDKVKLTPKQLKTAVASIGSPGIVFVKPDGIYPNLNLDSVGVISNNELFTKGGDNG